MAIDSALLRLLACPSCRFSLTQEEEALVCSKCGKSYPVIDGIPHLVVR
jgi:uncharacterized protein YbaR (Trm112 family)